MDFDCENDYHWLIISTVHPIDPISPLEDQLTKPSLGLNYNSYLENQFFKVDASGHPWSMVGTSLQIVDELNWFKQKEIWVWLFVSTHPNKNCSPWILNLEQPFGKTGTHLQNLFFWWTPVTHCQTWFPRVVIVMVVHIPEIAILSYHFLPNDSNIPIVQWGPLVSWFYDGRPPSYNYWIYYWLFI